MMNRYTKFSRYFTRLLSQYGGTRTITEVAQDLGVTQSTLSKIKVGLTLPSKTLAHRIAEAWGIENFVEEVEKERQASQNKAHQSESDMFMDKLKALMNNDEGRALIGRFSGEIIAGEDTEETEIAISRILNKI